MVSHVYCCFSPFVFFLLLLLQALYKPLQEVAYHPRRSEGPHDMVRVGNQELPMDKVCWYTVFMGAVS